IGCGNGSLTNELAAGGMEMTGMDASQSGLAIGRKSHPHIPFLDADIESPRPGHLKNGFDAVVASDVIEHLLLPRALFKRAREALHPGGVLVMTTPYHGYLKNLALALTNQFDQHWHPLRDYGHIKFFSARTLSQLAEEEGFHVNRMARLGRIPPLAKSIIIQGVLS
ncbi:MAG TPA: class I SAM-dependent methyltransferase, partial [Verrucomicrobiae bacterium]|nr:class I SAM-dependent methyltransferase [Verrucomicrobiae bacterium]